MSEINVKIGEDSRSIAAPVSVAEVLKSVDREAAKKALAARINGREVDLNYQLNPNGEQAVSVEPILPDTRDGLEVIRHSTAHLFAAALLDLYPGTKLGVGP